MNHLDFTAAQAEAILKQAGELAVERAKFAYELGIVDPMTLQAGLVGEERCADLIDYMIRSDEGLGWSGRAPYRYNGDAFQWCGAFVAYCMPWIALPLRVLYWSSTDRLNAYAQRKLLFGNSREREAAKKFALPPQAAGSAPFLDRKFLAFDESSVAHQTIPGFTPRAGDIGLVGPARARSDFRPHGQHVVLITERSGPNLGTYEGNATGEIPGRPETKTRPVQGVISTWRPIGLTPSDSLDDYHLRRWIRPSFFDVDLDLFVKYGGVLPT